MRVFASSLQATYESALREIRNMHYLVIPEELDDTMVNKLITHLRRYQKNWNVAVIPNADESPLRVIFNEDMIQYVPSDLLPKLNVNISTQYDRLPSINIPRRSLYEERTNTYARKY